MNPNTTNPSATARLQQVFLRGGEPDWAAAIAALRAGADIDALLPNSAGSDRAGKTLLSQACQNRHDDEVRWLLEQGADPNAAPPGGLTPLWRAIKSCNAETVRLLLAAGADPNGKTDRLTHLLWLPFAGDPDARDRRSDIEDFVETAIGLLLDQGADPSVLHPDDGRTVSQVLADAYGARMAEALDVALARPARATVRRRWLNQLTAEQRVTWLPKSCALEDTKAADVEAMDPDATAMLQRALCAAEPDWKGADTALRAGASLHATVPRASGMRLLACVSARGQNDRVLWLLERGADPNAMDITGTTALTVAIRSRHTETARLLLAHGANPNAPTAAGQTPLMTAACGAVETARLLLDAGAIPDARDREGQSALMYAAEFGCVEAIGLLLEHGADPNARDRDGQTPLMLLGALDHRDAIGRPRSCGDAIEVLLARRADPSLVDSEGNTALDFFVARGRTALIETLDVTLAETRHESARRRLLNQMPADQHVTWLPKSSTMEAALHAAKIWDRKP